MHVFSPLQRRLPQMLANGALWGSRFEKRALRDKNMHQKYALNLCTKKIV